MSALLFPAGEGSTARTHTVPIEASGKRRPPGESDGRGSQPVEIRGCACRASTKRGEVSGCRNCFWS